MVELLPSKSKALSSNSSIYDEKGGQCRMEENNIRKL
jgi:hypothetical protein